MSTGSRTGRLLLVLLGFLGGALAAYLTQRGSWWLADANQPTESIARAQAGKVVAAQSAEARAIAQRLKAGGYIVYFRHAQRQKWDSVIAFDVYETANGVDSTTRSFADAVCLTPQGKEEGLMIGQIFALAKAPIGRVVASPSCRARQTAQLAFGRVDRLEMALVHTPVVNVTNADGFKRGLRTLLETVPIEPGTNTAIVAHGNTLNNHPDLFAAGAEFLGEPLMETGLLRDRARRGRHAADRAQVRQPRRVRRQRR
jgi:broad specificity phosphatase PhoE